MAARSFSLPAPLPHFTSCRATGGTASLLVSPQMLEQQPKGGGWIVQPYFLPAAAAAGTILFVNSGSLMVWDLKTGQHRHLSVRLII